ncbi:phosphate ABC transporter permease subunit PstC [Mariniluteicoccus endophyticus]
MSNTDDFGQPLKDQPEGARNAFGQPVPDDPTMSPVAVAGKDGADPAVAPPVPQVQSRAQANADPSPVTDEPATGKVQLAKVGKAGDKVFLGLSWAAAIIIVSVVAFVGIFLVMMAAPSLAQNDANFLTSREWNVGGERLAFGIAGLLWTTVLTSVVAMIIAVPIAVGCALLITMFLPKRLASPFGFVIELLAAVPSIIFGLWGIKVLAPFLNPMTIWLQHTFGWFPLLGEGLSSTGTAFVASVVLAIMILPIVTSMSRDVFAQTPRDHIEAALALGATKWEVIKTAVFPYGRSGVISASMLGLGRALGETVAVMIILAQEAAGSKFNPSLFAGGETFASKIANNAPEFDTPSKTGAYIAAGLVLFIVTFVVNATARMIADSGKVKS